MNKYYINETTTDNSYSLDYGNNNIIEIRKVLRQLYEFNKFKINDESNPGISKIFGDKLFAFSKSNGIEISTDDQDYDRPIIRLLEHSGFQLKYAKILYEKELEGHQFLFKNIFEYKSIAEIGLNKFLEVFKEVVKDDPERDVVPEVYFNDLVEFAGDKYNPKNWKAVVLEGRYIGVMMLPQIFPCKEELGSLFYIGLIPEARNKGYGRIIHSKCLELLKERGAKKYIGSTNINNKPMLRVFNSNGCKEMFKRFIYSTTETNY